LHYRTSPIPSESLLMKAVVDEQAIESVVVSEVASAVAIDLHTHLLPPSHGSLCLWGIDELLTYVSVSANECSNTPMKCGYSRCFAAPL
jgi:hypothetical protein